MFKNCFLVFSDDFGEHPSSCQHLFRYLPKDYLVLWVNTVGMRTPRLTGRDFEKAVLKSKKMIYSFFSKNRKTLHAGNIHVLQPPMLPFLSIPGIRSINQFSVNHFVRKQLNRLNMKAPVLVITAPNACDHIERFRKNKVVYYCVDDYTEWPGFQKDLVKSMEEELIRKSDILIATSQKIYDKLSKAGKKIHLLTHGVDYDFFTNAPASEHPLLKYIPKPRVGYFGLFDERSDQNLILELARRMPDISFVITGNLETDTSRLLKEKNIYFTGSIPYSELPAMSKGWDLCILPYKVNKLTDAIQPLKIKEYLASGKPVISVPIKEACRLKDYVIISETVESWERDIRICIRGLSFDAFEKRKAFLQGESWAKKAEEFFNICFVEGS